MAKRTWTTDEIISKTLLDNVLYGSADGESADDLTKLAVKDQSGAGTKALQFLVSETLAADRVLTITVGTSDRSITLSGNISLAGTLTTAAAVTTVGANALTLRTSAPTDITLPTTGTLATLDGSEVLTTKSLTAPAITGGTAIELTGLSVRSTGGNDLIIASTAIYTGDRTLTINIPVGANAALTLTGDLIRAGAHSLTLTTTGTTDVTLPTTGTLVSSAVTTLSSLVSVGTLTTGTWNATPVTVPYGGTGLTTITDHGVMLGSGTGAVTPTAAGTSGQPLLSGGAGADPNWGTLTVPYGGTGTTTLTIHGVLLGQTAGAITATAAGTAGQPLLSGGAGADPNWGTLGVAYGGTGTTTFTIHGVLLGQTAGAVTATAAGTALQVLQSGGAAADPVWSTATYPATTTVNQILWSGTANIVGGLTTGNSGVLVTSGAGVPSIATDIPTAVTIGSAYITRVGGTDVTMLDGGTGASLTAAAGAIPYSGAAAMALLAAGSAGQLLRSGGAAAPTWTTLTIPATIAVHEMYYASSANVLGVITPVNSSVLVMGGAGVPSWVTDIPTAVTIGGAAIYRAAGTDVAVADGGTNISAYTVGDLLVATVATTLAPLIDVAVGQVLCSGGVGVIPAWSAAPTFTSSVQTGRGEVGRLNFNDDTTLTMDANGEVTVTQTYHAIDTNAAGASDDLEAITGGAEGDIIIIYPVDATHSVVAQHTGGATAGDVLNLAGGANFTMDEDDDFLMLLHDGTVWQEISRSENHA